MSQAALARLGLAVLVAVAATGLMFRPPAAHAGTPPPDSARAQRPGRPGGEPPSRARDARADEQETRDFIARRLDDLEKRRAVLEEAQRRLDAGEPVDQVRAHLRSGLRTGTIWDPPETREHGPVGAGARRPGLPQGLPRPGARPGAPPRGPLPPEHRQQMREFLRATFPEALARIEEAARDNPAEVERRLQEWAPRVRELLELRDREPELYELRVREVRAQFRAGPLAYSIAQRLPADGPVPAEVEADIAKLRELVTELVDARLEAKRLEVERLRARLDRVVQDVDRQGQERPSLIEAMVRQM
ncbi:MAG TPA: hypothetical protein VD963_00755, partial [Phycisphaerales bacterium]|nr:hypothetical protein [Phycisphaerales bacterium]